MTTATAEITASGSDGLDELRGASKSRALRQACGIRWQQNVTSHLFAKISAD